MKFFLFCMVLIPLYLGQQSNDQQYQIIVKSDEKIEEHSNEQQQQQQQSSTLSFTSSTTISTSIGKNMSLLTSELFKGISSTQSSQKNVFFSPASIYIALSMVALGSNCENLNEFKKVLNFDSKKDLAQKTKIFLDILTNSNQNNGGVSISVANKIYSGLPNIREEYQQLMNCYFDSEIETVDFKKDHEKVRIAINEWVESATNQKIKDLLGQGTIDELTRFIIVNALYFKGSWDEPFDGESTKESLFYLQNDSKEQENYNKNMIKVDFMHKESSNQYYQDASLQYISIPYEGKEFTMEIILPKSSILELEKDKGFQVQKLLENARNNAQEQEGELILPKFKIEGSSMDLKQILQENIGLKHAFSDNADFSFMDRSKSIKIDSVIHKGMIEVNEEGTEAAAASGVLFVNRMGFMKDFVMNCNKPFIFTITHLPSGTLLFLGKIMDPSKNV